MRLKQKSHCFILAALLFCALPAVALAEVSVYAEGAYTATDLVVYIYADITGDPLCSYGVKLGYNGEKVTVDTANTEINEAVWYFGSPPPANTACPNCVVTSTDGEIVFIGPKLDTSDPTEGVIGTRILLAIAAFDRVLGQNTEFEITLGLGKTNPSPPPTFDNFVTVPPATVLDGSVAFGSVTIHERGDANGDSQISSSDFTAIRSLFFQGKYVVYADCDGNGSISSSDFTCVRNKFFNP